MRNSTDYLIISVNGALKISFHTGYGVNGKYLAKYETNPACTAITDNRLHISLSTPTRLRLNVR